MKPTKEQWQEVLEWCGFTSRKSQNSFIAQRVWLYPDGKEEWNFPIPFDLNNLEKYAFPKVLLKYDIEISSFCDDLNDNKIFWFVEIINKETGETDFANVEGCEKLEDALFVAIDDMRKESK